jgi:K+-transporting ATPase KdpC subunit
MSIVRETSRAIRVTLVLWVITAIIYPLAMVAFGQIAFPYQANGSLLENAQGQVIGSALIGQPFASDRYFNSRPSTTNYLKWSKRTPVTPVGLAGDELRPINKHRDSDTSTELTATIVES